MDMLHCDFDVHTRSSVSLSTFQVVTCTVYSKGAPEFSTSSAERCFLGTNRLQINWTASSVINNYHALRLIKHKFLFFLNLIFGASACTTLLDCALIYYMHCILYSYIKLCTFLQIYFMCAIR